MENGKKEIKASSTTEGKIIRASSAALGFALVLRWYRRRNKMTPQQIEEDNDVFRFAILWVVFVMIITGIFGFIGFFIELFSGNLTR